MQIVKMHKKTTCHQGTEMRYGSIEAPTIALSLNENIKFSPRPANYIKCWKINK